MFDEPARRADLSRRPIEPALCGQMVASCVILCAGKFSSPLKTTNCLCIASWPDELESSQSLRAVLVVVAGGPLGSHQWRAAAQCNFAFTFAFAAKAKQRKAQLIIKQHKRNFWSPCVCLALSLLQSSRDNLKQFIFFNHHHHHHQYSNHIEIKYFILK